MKFSPLNNLFNKDTRSNYNKYNIEAICCLGLLIAYLTHLGYTPLDTETDEARRALVTAEMMLSGNYVTPTLNGDLFLNKPPLYNWLVSLYFHLFGNWSMFVFRLPVIVATFLLGYITYVFVKKYTNHKIAFFTAFAYLTNGRILLYDSLQGFIDTSFAITVYISFMLIFLFGEKKKYYQLFISTYILCVAGFLMKGIPAIVFQGLSICTYFLMKKDFKKIFHPAHFLGFTIFIFLLGAYYYEYFANNTLPPKTLFLNLVSETTQKSALAYPATDTFTHLFTFPFEILYHFAPWTILVLACMHKKIRTVIRANSFLKYTFLVFVVNLIVYWVSPQVYPRYLFMFLPLIFTLFFYNYFRIIDYSQWQYKTIAIVMLFVCLVLCTCSLVFPFFPATRGVAAVYPKALFLFAGFTFSAWFMLRKRSVLFYGFALTIVFTRIAFNWFVVEQRGERYFVAENEGKTIADITQNKSLYILTGAAIGSFEGLSYHICTRRGKILAEANTIRENVYYIADKKQLAGKKYTCYFSFTNYLAPDSLKLVTFNIIDHNIGMKN